MGKQDVISKSILKRIFVDVATYLFGLELYNVQLIDTEQQRIEDRRADLVARVKEKNGNSFVIHIEIQNQNQTNMPIRMLRYLTDIKLSYPNEDVHQYLLYIGKSKLSMAKSMQSKQLNYQYSVIDMHTIDYQDFIKQNTPDAIVMSVLCDFKGVDEKEIIREILKKLVRLTKQSSKEQREYFSMLEVLATNRNIDLDIEQEIEMLNLEIEQLASYKIGEKRGEIRGEKRGEKRGEIRGEKRGEIRGEARGEIAKAIIIAKKMLEIGMTQEQIIELTGLTLEEIERIKH